MSISVGSLKFTGVLPTTDDVSAVRNGIFDNSYSILKPLKDYLWLADYRGIDYDFADKTLRERFRETNGGLCSAVRKGMFFGRNLDWYYNECASFIIRTEAHDGKHRTIGMAGGVTALTESFVKSRGKSDWYKVLPCVVSDGINDASVTACVNVVPKKTTSGWTGDEVICHMGVRTALDNFSTAAEAAAYLAAKVFVPTGYEYDVHYMISDKTSTWLVEDGAAKQISSRPYMTNFRIAEDSVVDNEVDFNLVNARDPYGMGLERMNLILEGYALCESESGMRTLLDQLKYTKTYEFTTMPRWITEYVGNDSYGDLTVIKTKEDPGAFTQKISDWTIKYANRSRDTESENYGTWQTVSSVVYDLDGQRMFVVVQESGPDTAIELRLDGVVTKTADGLMSAADKTKLETLSPVGNLGALAYADTASGSVSAGGTVSKPGITVTPTTTTVNNITLSYDAATEKLTFTSQDQVSVLTGVEAALESAPAFTPTPTIVTVQPDHS